jgi:hypothetical protein
LLQVNIRTVKVYRYQTKVSIDSFSVELGKQKILKVSALKMRADLVEINYDNQSVE